MIKSTLVRKKIGDKTYNFNNHKEIEYVEKLIPLVPEFLKKVVTESSYITNGEDLILIKNTEHCNLVYNFTFDMEKNFNYSLSFSIPIIKI